MNSHRVLLVVLVGIASPPLADAAARRIVHFSDVHLNLSTSLHSAESPSPIRPRYGSDAPLSLLASALQYASRVVLQPDVLLYTGDHVTHGKRFSNEYIREVVETNVRMLESYFPTDTMTGKPHHVTAITGNSDSNVSYSMDVSDHDAAATSATLSVVAPVWASSLSASNFDQFKRRGYVQYDIDESLSVLALNTVPYSPSHVPDTSHLRDPFEQFAWLNATLQSLRKASRVAFVAGHIPPIVDSNRTRAMWHEHYIQHYQSIVGEYRDVIKAQFFGHVHSLEFRLPPAELSPSPNLMPPLFTTGALSPKYGNNPLFTVWEYDADTYELQDYSVYSTDWSVAEPSFEWTLQFQASSAYGLTSLSTAELIKMQSRMAADASSSSLTEYYWNMKARSFNLPPCDDAACRARILCSLTWWPTQMAFADCTQATIISLSGGLAGVLSALPLAHILVGMLALFTAYIVMCTIAWAVRRKRRIGHASSSVAVQSECPQKQRKTKRHWVLPTTFRKGVFVAEARQAL